MNINTKQNITQTLSFDEHETYILTNLFYHISNLGSTGLKRTFGTDKDFGDSNCLYTDERLQEIVNLCKNTVETLEKEKENMRNI